MSGHSKWASIKHKKAAVDAKRGKIFTKIIREITIAARLGGGDVNANPRLRMAISNAKGVNMPSDNIKRAIMKGTGELPGSVIEEIVYEGYGPGGAALYIEVMTDNKNRTVAEIRHILTKHNGNLGASNSVAWKFEKKGVIYIDATKIEEDALMEIAIGAGAEDMRLEDDTFEVITNLADFETVKTALEGKKLEISRSEVTMLPKSVVKLDGKHAEQLLKMMEKLEDHEDIQNVYSDFDIPDDVMQKISSNE